MPLPKKMDGNPGKTHEERAQFKQCNICEEWLPLRAFPPKGQTCADDDLARESLQRLLRKRWGKGYKEALKELKKDKVKYARSVIQHRVSNTGKQRRCLQVGAEQLTQRKTQRHVHRAIQKRRKFTWFGYKQFFAKEENGGYSEGQCRVNWKKVTEKPHCDELGVVEGVGGHKRWRVDILNDESESEAASISDREYAVGTKARKEMDASDVHDFLRGLRGNQPVT